MPRAIPSQVRKIASFEGKWNVMLSVRPEPSGDWLESKATCVMRLILDGAGIEQDFEGRMIDRPFLGKGLIAHNRFTGKWQHVWTDNLAGHISVYEGDFRDGELTLFGREISDGGEFSVRIRWYNIEPDRFDWVLETSVDENSWGPVMKAVYTRKKG